MTTNPYLRPRDAAALIGLSPSTLAKMRLRGDGPKYFKLGRRLVGYARSEIDAWLANRQRASTSERAD